MFDPNMRQNKESDIVDDATQMPHACRFVPSNKTISGSNRQSWHSPSKRCHQLALDKGKVVELGSDNPFAA
jgi:hypothetical protein